MSVNVKYGNILMTEFRNLMSNIKNPLREKLNFILFDFLICGKSEMIFKTNFFENLRLHQNEGINHVERK